MCRLRLVAVLWGEQAEQQSLTAIIIVASTDRAHANAPCTISVMMCFMPMSFSRLQYWSGLVQHDEERLLKRLLNANDKGQAAARKKQAAELKKAEKRKSEVDTLFARMYEDWVAGAYHGIQLLYAVREVPKRTG